MKLTAGRIPSPVHSSLLLLRRRCFRIKILRQPPRWFRFAEERTAQRRRDRQLGLPRAVRAGLRGTVVAVMTINWNPSRRELRQFAGLCLVFFGGIAAWMYARHGAGAWPLGLPWGPRAGPGAQGRAAGRSPGRRREPRRRALYQGLLQWVMRRIAEAARQAWDPADLWCSRERWYGTFGL